jgi:hypothetical protein
MGINGDDGKSVRERAFALEKQDLRGGWVGRSDGRLGRSQRCGCGRGTSACRCVRMDPDVLVLQDLSESRITRADLINLNGELFPAVFISRTLRNRLLAIDQKPLLLIEGPTKKYLFNQKKADK